MGIRRFHPVSAVEEERPTQILPGSYVETFFLSLIRVGLAPGVAAAHRGAVTAQINAVGRLPAQILGEVGFLLAVMQGHEGQPRSAGAALTNPFRSLSDDLPACLFFQGFRPWLMYRDTLHPLSPTASPISACVKPASLSRRIISVRRAVSNRRLSACAAFHIAS